MNLKQTFRLLFVLLAVQLMYSCNGNTEEIVYESPSKDAQIYSFSLSAISRSGSDSLKYIVLGKTGFVINQTIGADEGLIYNPDSLPQAMNLAKFLAVMNFSPGGSPSEISIIYPNDSIVKWNTADSIDFSKPIKLRVLAADASVQRNYNVKLLVHTREGDSIKWLPQASGNILSERNKTILNGNDFYTFAKNGGSLSVAKYSKTTNVWTASVAISSPIQLESITLLNKFYAVDNTGHAYQSASTSGFAWTDLGDQKAVSILGVLPGATTADDALLVVRQRSAGVNYLATTKDMTTFTEITTVDGWAQVGGVTNIASGDFPLTDFSSATQYSLANNQLTLSQSYQNGSGKWGIRTWLIKKVDNQRLQATSTEGGNPPFATKPVLSTYFYAGDLYAYTPNTFYVSSTLGYKWGKASEYQALNMGTTPISNQSIVVDADNYVWIFGGKADNTKILVWKGHLNKLNFKIQK